jgi:hypothetical protein
MKYVLTWFLPKDFGEHFNLSDPKIDLLEAWAFISKRVTMIPMIYRNLWKYQRDYDEGTCILKIKPGILGMKGTQDDEEWY